MNSTGMCSSDDEDDATDDAKDGDAKEGSTISDAIEINSNTENRSERERERERERSKRHYLLPRVGLTRIVRQAMLF